MSSGSFKNYYQQTIRLQIIYTYKQDLALNNLQGLIRCKTQPTNVPSSLNLFIVSFSNSR